MEAPVRHPSFALLFVSAILLSPVYAAEPIFSPVEVAPGIYAVVGDLGGPSYENEGQNSNLGFIVTPEGVVAINTGASARVARALHAVIKGKTDKPVKWAINVNSQPHYWLGNDYFQSIGAKVISHKAADHVMRESGPGQLERTKELLKERATGTKLAYPDVLYADKHVVKLGGSEIEVLHLGPAHTPGDSVVWLPRERVLFTGDVVYTERMLAVIPISNTGAWIKAFDRAAALNPKVIVPGHGHPTDVGRATKETRGYLVDMRAQVKKKQDDFMGLQDVVDTVDQSKYQYLLNFDLLARRNVNQIYLEMEREAFQ